MTRVYCALSMTGRDAREVLADQRAAAMALRARGLVPLDPAKEEGVKAGDGILRAPEDLLRQYWKRDKQLIRRAHVVLDLTGTRKSAGVEAEIGYARWFLYKPTVRVWAGLGPSIARFEGDAIVSSAAEAADVIQERWGTPFKRLCWRWRMTNRCIVGYFWNQIREWANAVCW